MNFEQLINARQSDRKYDTQPIDRALLVRCLEAARIAPSACNSQPWKFVVVDDPKLLAGMKEAAAGMGMNKWVTDVPVIVAVVLEKMNLTARIGSVIKDKEYSLLDVGIAVEHFCLQATELGLGTCIIGWFDEKKVKKLLDIPKRRVPLLISVGYPASEHRKKVRKPLEEMSSWNKKFKKILNARQLQTVMKHHKLKGPHPNFPAPGYNGACRTNCPANAPATNN